MDDSSLLIFNTSYWKVWGKKYDNLIRKNANIKGKRWKNRTIFTVPREKKYHVGRKG